MNFFKKMFKVVKKALPYVGAAIGGYLLGTAIIPKFFGTKPETKAVFDAEVGGPIPETQPSVQTSFWGELGKHVGELGAVIGTGYISSLFQPETQQANPPPSLLMFPSGIPSEGTFGTLAGMTEGEVFSLGNLLRPPIVYILIGIGVVLLIPYMRKK